MAAAPWTKDSLRLLATDYNSVAPYDPLNPDTSANARVIRPTQLLPPDPDTGYTDIDCNRPLSVINPLAVGTAAPGISEKVSREDHVHAHGNQAGGSLHANASTLTAGFMSASDKSALDSLVSGGGGGVPTTRTISTTAPLAGGGALSADLTFSIPAATTLADGYMTTTQVSALADRIPASLATAIDQGLYSTGANAWSVYALTTFGRTLAGSADAAAAKTHLSLSKGDVGLGNVDNTADAGKSVSYATTAGSATPIAHAASHAIGGSDPVSYGLNDLTDVTLTAVALGDMLYNDGSAWKNSPMSSAPWALKSGATLTGPFIFAQGTGAPGTAGITIPSAPLLLTPEAGAFERLADSLYLTITTGTARKPVVLADAALVSGQIPFATTNGRIAGATAWTRNATTGQVTQTYNGTTASVYQLVNTTVAAAAQAYNQYTVDAGSWYFGAESNAGGLSPGGAFIYTAINKPFRLYTAGVQRLEVSGPGILTSAAVGNVFTNYGKFGSAGVGANTLLSAGNVAGSFGGSTAAIHFTDNSVNATVNYQNTNAAGYTAFDFFNSAGAKSATFAWSNASAGFANTLWIATRTASDFWFGTNTTERLRIAAAGNIGVGESVPTAALHVKAGTAAVGTAPVKITAGTVNTLPEAGAVEFDGIAYYLTVGTTRRRIALVTPPTTVIAGPYTVLDTDDTLLVNCTTLAITINLPSAIQAGRELTVKKIDSTALAVTIDASGAQTIDGDLTQGITSRNVSLTMVADGANWWIK